VTRSKHLHFGFWEPGEELDMKNLRVAQDRYLRHLLSYIPAGVKTVLDAGCGVGGNAVELKNRGYDVVSLSPDPYQEKVFRENTGGKVQFCLTGFEDFRAERRFDLVLMSESFQYMDLTAGLKKCREVLNGRGWVLISDFFKVDGVDDREVHISGHSLSGFLKELEAEGFKIARQEDVTDRTGPTLNFMISLFNDYAIPSIRMLAYAMETYIPFVYKISRRLFRSPIKKALEKSLVDDKTFAKCRRYMFYLLQLQ